MDIIGIDIGFGFTKATNGKDSLVFKSVFGEALDVQFKENIIDPQKKYEHLHIEIDGSAFFVGEMAECQSNVRFFTLDQGQFIDRFAKTLSLAALSRIVDNYKSVKVLTGLPVGYYRRHKDSLVKILQGKHTITCINEDGERQERIIDISEVRVVPQPFGSLFNLLLNGKGDNKRFFHEKIGIVDIGFRTSDYTISNRTKYAERGSRTTESGIAHAFTTIATKLHEISGVNPELYRLYEAVDRGSIKIRGKQYDLKKFTEQVFSQLAAEVAGEANQLWADDWDIDTIVITGGGAPVLAPFLKPLLHGQVLEMDSSKDGRLNNVQGYLSYGKHVWNRKK